MIRFFTTLAFLGSFSFFAHAAEPADLCGKWLLTMPRGFEYDAVLEAREPGLYYLRCGAFNLQGLYELRGKRLTMVQPTEPRMTGLVWEVKNLNALELIVHPKESQFGSNYRMATLGRQKAAGPRIREKKVASQ